MQTMLIVRRQGNGVDKDCASRIATLLNTYKLPTLKYKLLDIKNTSLAFFDNICDCGYI